MNTYVAFLRGINVGGKNPLPMKELVAILEGIGALKVKTYIQSGNAVFKSTETDPALLSGLLAAAINNQRGFKPEVLVLPAHTLEKAIAANPFPEAESAPASLHLGFLASAPVNPDMQKLNSLKKANERFHLSDGVFYLHAPDGVGRSKLAANTERLLGVATTDRNWRTVCKVLELTRG